jgi:hypothetical protein
MLIGTRALRKAPLMELKYPSHKLAQSLHEAISDLVFNQPLG